MKTRQCAECGAEFEGRTSAVVCSDECRDARRKASKWKRVGQSATEARLCTDGCGDVVGVRGARGRCTKCYRKYRRENPHLFPCAVEGCGASRVAGGLCSTHYQRQQVGSPLTLEMAKCDGCGKEFMPDRSYEKFCTHRCASRVGARRRLGIASRPIVRACWWCDGPFDGQDYRRRCCPGECTRIANSLQSIVGRYGITPDDYKAMWRAQSGVCASCKRPASGKRAKRLHVDHDHTCCPGQTSCGLCVRGLLCGQCNSINGHANDSVELLEANIAYLKATRQFALFRAA